MKISLHDKFLFTLDCTGKLIIYDILLGELNFIIKIGSKAKKILLNPFDEKKICILSQYSGSVFNIESGKIIKEFSESRFIFDAVFCSNGNSIIILSNQLKIQKISMRITEFFDLIDLLKVGENFMKIKNLFSDNKNSKDLLNELSNNLKNICENVAPFVNFPFEMTVLHLMTYLEMTEEIILIMEYSLKNSIFFPLTSDSFGNTIFNIAFTNGNNTLIQLFVYYYSSENIAIQSFRSCSMNFTYAIKNLMQKKMENASELINSRIFQIKENVPNFGENLYGTSKSKGIFIFLFNLIFKKE